MNLCVVKDRNRKGRGVERDREVFCLKLISVEKNV